MTHQLQTSPKNGETARPGSPIRDLMLLALACTALWGWTYGRWGFWGPDEPRYVEIARELLGRANWFVLTVLDQPYDQKSPLPYMMMAVMLKLSHGVVTSWVVRVPSLLFGIGTVFLTYQIGLRRLGRRAGWLAAWVMLTASLFIDEVASARLDTLMTGFVALAMWAWLAAEPGEGKLSPGRCLLFWLGVTGALFIKGPVAFVFVLGTAGIEAWRARSWHVVARLRPVWGLAAMSAVVIAYFVTLKHSVSGQYVQAQLHTVTWARLFPNMHREWPWFYLSSLFGGGFMPWSLIMVLALVALWRSNKGIPAEAGTPKHNLQILRPILIWALWPLLFLSIVITKRSQYLLPSYPAMALVIGAYLDERWDSGEVKLWVRRLVAGIMIVMGVVLIAGAAAALANKIPGALLKTPDMAAQLDLVRQAPWFAARVAAMGVLGLLLAICGVLWFKAATLRRAMGILIPALFVAGIAWLGVANPLLDPVKSPREVNLMIQSFTRAPGEVIGALDSAFKAQYMVFGNYRLVELNNDLDPKTGKGLKNLPDVLRRKGTSLPRILLSSPDDDKKGKNEDVLKEFGYQRVWTAPSASQNHLMIYVKK